MRYFIAAAVASVALALVLAWLVPDLKQTGTSSAPPTAPGGSPSFQCEVVPDAIDPAYGMPGPPRFEVTASVSQDTQVGSLTLVGYDSTGTETGSTNVSVGQFVTAGQTQVWSFAFPSGWFTTTDTSFPTSVTTCQVAAWSQV